MSEQEAAKDVKEPEVKKEEKKEDKKEDKKEEEGRSSAGTSTPEPKPQENGDERPGKFVYQTIIYIPQPLDGRVSKYPIASVRNRDEECVKSGGVSVLLYMCRTR